MGYKVILWDVMTCDWQEDISSAKIASRIIHGVKPGSIIVMHDGRGTRHNYNREQMLAALPGIIQNLQRQGYQFVTLSQLLDDK